MILKIIAIAIVLIVGTWLWINLGNRYIRLSLIGTQYVENSDELANANHLLDEPLYLVKKYKYSKKVWLISFSKGSTRIDDYYVYGVADKNKNLIIPIKYQYLNSLIGSAKDSNDPEEKIIYVYGLEYIKTGKEKKEFFKIENNKAIFIEGKEW